MRYTHDPNDLGAVNIFIDLYKPFYDNRILMPGLSANGISKRWANILELWEVHGCFKYLYVFQKHKITMYRSFP